MITELSGILLSTLAQIVTPSGRPAAAGQPLPRQHRRTGGRPLIVADRGCSAEYPENTLIAIEKAIDVGADWVHVDVRLSRDGVPVIIRDARVDRTTSGKGRVADLSLAELRELDAGSWVDRSFCRERIPTLTEVLDLCRDAVKVSVELRLAGETATEEDAAHLVQEVARLVEQCGAGDHVHYTSPHPGCVRNIAQLVGRLGGGYIDDGTDTLRGLYVARQQGLEAYHPCFPHLSPVVMAHARAQGVMIITHQCESIFEYLGAIHLGVDGIVTGDPDSLKRLALKLHDESHSALDAIDRVD